MSESPLTAQRDAPVGGQAVLEGVMMRGVSTWAVAVRKPAPEQLVDGKLPRSSLPEGEIAVESLPVVSWTRRSPVLRRPVVRGVVALGQSLNIGFNALSISANAQLGEEQKELGGAAWAATIAAALALAVGLFFVVPVALTSLIKDRLDSAFLFWLVEGVLRTGIFLGYLAVLSRQRELRRVFEYHGAEHKVIACYEAGLALEPETARRFSRLHPRCGTSFLLVVMIVAIFVFAPLGLPAWYLLVATRILGVPLIAGISFELIKWAGRNRAKGWVQAIMWPGMQLQKLTTREPDLAQLTVAIAALQAVLDVEDPREASGEDLLGMEVVA
ncbi:DUF1385 domain-containing protein [Candidatus Solirubrobacter pratensis]|uniref:DUF1385 domain-containing protein n=1 Tax=Candidatus Solirubrobacter pratensis TaxID=1298857 RepID=UPI0004066188|nr:DUF1385 domain-containing protein [Candidatus Solirubrobacter pratensis]